MEIFVIIIIFFVFGSLVRNENIKRPGHTLQVTSVFSNFP